MLISVRERKFCILMGRIAGVSAAETRDRLLRAAADAFAERGYDGARVADIAAAAGVTRGAMYAHFGSKADLLACALRTHCRRVLAEMFTAGPGMSITDLLVVMGGGSRRLGDAKGYLLVEALVAARRDKEMAAPMGQYVSERAERLGSLMRAAQSGDEIDPELSPNALAHLCLLLGVGSALVTPDLHAVEEREWAVLVSRLQSGLARARTTAQTGVAQ
jgi:AcrR family transcriptional regulator